MQWTITNRLPENEPDETNRAEYAHPQLMGGASDDGRFVFDVVWAEMEECFVLTFLWVNDEFGFLEDQIREYPKTRTDLLARVAEFQAAPELAFQNAA
ncbi:hypothetical protein [Kingella negevensis]|uniref:hypothetical protein n=1 Tax=Kingella negevensis TaxID=1522312 RepID=UPI00050A16B9|nr:hypothetical protein [Kingella negevensis]MDK4688180.1 hypothetical protein [Kingella negevensis]WII90835.1 hypothetical protein QEO93_10610 [Kingella negevensis]